MIRSGRCYRRVTRSLRAASGSRRQSKEELAAPAGRAVDSDLAAMRLNQGSYDRESQAQPALRPLLRLPHVIEYVGKLDWVDSGPLIGYLEANCAWLGMGADQNGSVGRAELDRIVEQVPEDLQNAMAIARHDGTLYRVHFDAQRDDLWTRRRLDERCS